MCKALGSILSTEKKKRGGISFMLYIFYHNLKIEKEGVGPSNIYIL
jgi:hypothetical protein